MSEEESKEVAVWQPKAFTGNDLLPIKPTTLAVHGVPELVGRENVDPKDLVLPSLALLHGTSTAVTDKVEDAKPGHFMHTGTEEVFPEGDVRLIIAHHHKGNALFPQNKERYAGLETCISKDGVEGTKYGLCEECRKCLDWDNANQEPPLGAEVHHFVCMTDRGLLILRMSRSAYAAGNKFVSTWVGSDKNLWAHPVVVRVIQKPKTLPTGKITQYYTLQMAWQQTEKTPDALQRAAYKVYQEVKGKHESGNLRSKDDDVDDGFNV